MYRMDQCNQVIYILPEIYFTNLYRFPETENLLYIDLKTCQYHSVHFRYNLHKLVRTLDLITVMFRKANYLVILRPNQFSSIFRRYHIYGA